MVATGVATRQNGHGGRADLFVIGGPGRHLTVTKTEGEFALVQWPVGNAGETDGFVQLQLGLAGFPEQGDSPITRIPAGAGVGGAQPITLTARIDNLPDPSPATFVTLSAAMIDSTTGSPRFGLKLLGGDHIFDITITPLPPTPPDLFVVGDPTIL